MSRDIMLELRMLKKEKGMVKEGDAKRGIVKNELDFAFLFVVDIVKQESKLIIAGGREL